MNQKRMNYLLLPYLLFDLIALGAIVAIAIKLFGNGAIYFDNVADLLQTASKTPWRQQQQSTPSQIFSIGDIVEVHDPKINEEYAFFAEIDRIYKSRNGSRKYEVCTMDGRHRECFHSIDESRMRLNEILDYRTKVMCDHGGSVDSSIDQSKHHYACTILSSYDDGKKQAYNVVMLFGNGDITHQQVPMAKIRSIAKMPAHLEEKFDRLDSLDPSRNRIDPHSLELSGVLERVDDQIQYAYPLLVSAYGKNNTATLLHPFTFDEGMLRGANLKHFQPYRVYEDGTLGLCKLGKLDIDGNVDQAPCTVDSHSLSDNGVLLYEVSYYGDEEELVSDTLPFTKIWRSVGERKIKQELMKRLNNECNSPDDECESQ